MPAQQHNSQVIWILTSRGGHPQNVCRSYRSTLRGRQLLGSASPNDPCHDRRRRCGGRARGGASAQAQSRCPDHADRRVRSARHRGGVWHERPAPPAQRSGGPDVCVARRYPDHFCRWLDERAVPCEENFAPRLAYARYLQEQLAAADVRLEVAEVVGLKPGAPARLELKKWTYLVGRHRRARGRPPQRWHAGFVGTGIRTGAGHRNRRQGRAGSVGSRCACGACRAPPVRRLGDRIRAHRRRRRPAPHCAGAPRSRCYRVTANSRGDSAQPAHRRTCRTSMHSLPRSRWTSCAPR